MREKIYANYKRKKRSLVANKKCALIGTSSATKLCETSVQVMHKRKKEYDTENAFFISFLFFDNTLVFASSDDIFY